MKKSDSDLVIIYLVLNCLIGFTYYLNLFDNLFLKRIFGLLQFSYALLLYGIFYNRLWNNKVLLIWSLIGALQLTIYFLFRDLPELQTVRGNYISTLKTLPITLLTYSLLNWINGKLYGDPYIVTALRFDSEIIHEGDKRKIRPMDYIFSGIGFMIIITTLVLTP